MLSKMKDEVKTWVFDTDGTNMLEVLFSLCRHS